MAISDTSGRASTTHRLPTLSASQALQSICSKASHPIPTGVAGLDTLLTGHGLTRSPVNATGGLVRGQVTEVYGPPGVGKTTFGMQACACAIRSGDRAVWVDTAAPLATKRLDDLSLLGSSDQTVKTRFHHFTAPTLAHLLALFVHPVPSFPPKETSLIIVDTISTPFENAYHRESRSTSNSDVARWASSRKFAVMNELINKLEKMATLHNVAVIVICQTSTKLRQGGPAMLLPAISGHEWEAGISTRLCIFMDWPPMHQSGERDRIRYVGVIKAGGITLGTHDGGVGAIVPFKIQQTGLIEVTLEPAELPIPILSSPAHPLKRSRDEVADSDAEELGSEDDYGWGNDDEIAAENLIEETTQSVEPIDDEDAASTEQDQEVIVVS